MLCQQVSALADDNGFTGEVLGSKIRFQGFAFVKKSAASVIQ